jgi:raffinose/stachyose/melibiose transport system substrate-binding protein
LYEGKGKRGKLFYIYGGVNMKVKKLLVLITVVAMIVGMMTGCGSKNNATSTDNGNSATEDVAETKDDSVNSNEDTASEKTSDAGTADLSGTKISFLNSKGEIQTALEEMAKEFEAETGISVEIIACGTGESPYTKITSMYNSGTAPTMAMLDTTDVIALAEEHALDLSSEQWTKECEDQLTKINGKVYSFPFCVEGRGLIYNKKAIEDTLGTSFDPSTINSYDALKKLLENLRAAGMENPVVISKEDWSLGAHQLGFIYDTYDGTTEGSAELINKLKDGSLKVEDYERFNQFIDTMDLLLEYNINGDDPLGAIYEQDPIFLVDGKAAIWANGCWAWPNLEEAGASKDDEYGFIPFVLGNDTSDFANNAIQAAATKQVMIDSTKATDNEVAAAKEFLNWIVYNDQGQKMLVETAAVIPACSNNPYTPLDPLGKDIQEKMASGKTYSSSFIAPSDHWSVLGASMQKYIAKQSTKEELAAEIDSYWTSQK